MEALAGYRGPFSIFKWKAFRLDWTVHDTRYVTSKFHQIPSNFYSIEFLSQGGGLDADRKPFKNRDGRYGYRRNRPQGVARFPTKAATSFHPCLSPRYANSLPRSMAARDAARIHIQISRCAAAHRVFFFPFRIVNFHGALVARRDGKEGRDFD